MCDIPHVDIDECFSNTSGCHRGCINTNGSFYCICEDGYMLSDDGMTCVDVNECAIESHGCQQACINTMGAFWCGCYIGYDLNDDLKTCSGNLH